MDVFTAIKERRSCRGFSADPVDEDSIEQIIEAGTWAPSPLNAQPWEFMVILSEDVKEQIYSEAKRCREWAIETSGWKWLGKYQVEFVKSAPVIIAVVGDPQKTGVDMFQEEGHMGYQHACAAAIQNMQLAAHAMDYGTLWFTLYDKSEMRKILGVPDEKVPLAMVLLGKKQVEPPAVPRKEFRDKIRYIL